MAPIRYSPPTQLPVSFGFQFLMRPCCHFSGAVPFKFCIRRWFSVLLLRLWYQALVSVLYMRLWYQALVHA